MKTILIIDDQKSSCLVIRKILEISGYTVFDAQAGALGISIIKQEKPDLILLDYIMPEMDGLDVLGIIRQKNIKTPIIMLTADRSQKVSIQAFRAGLTDFLAKPIDRDLLLALITRVLRDADMRKQLEQTLVSEQAIKESNRSKSEFIANMSHELRTALHIILSFSRMNIEEISKGSGANLSKIEQQSLRVIENSEGMMSLINNILDLAKMEVGNIQVNRNKVNLLLLAESTQQSFEILLSEKNISFQILPPKCSTIVLGDSIMFKRVFSNLISNAIKFSEKNGKILIFFEKAHIGTLPVLIVSVQDNGVGVPKREQKNIFNKFIQSSRTNDGSGGTGLGLSICQQIIELHGGKIKTHPASGGGSIFSFSIPMK